MKPTFLCIGAQKAGTSSLATHFNKHPEVFFHNTEQHFFNNPENFSKGISVYEENFISDKKYEEKKLQTI